MSKVDCDGIKPSRVLAMLYNKADPIGLGVLQYKKEPMTESEAQNLLDTTKYFDYVSGRPLKVSFSNFPILDPSGYDQNQGKGSMQRCVDSLRRLDAGPDAGLDAGSEAKQNVKHSGKILADFPEIKIYDSVWFVDSFCKELGKRGIPYPNDFHMFMGEESGKYKFIGSLGGITMIEKNESVIKGVSTK